VWQTIVLQLGVGVIGPLGVHKCTPATPGPAPVPVPVKDNTIIYIFFAEYAISTMFSLRRFRIEIDTSLSTPAIPPSPPGWSRHFTPNAQLPPQVLACISAPPVWSRRDNKSQMQFILRDIVHYMY
jgi:hypothetical protein